MVLNPRNRRLLRLALFVALVCPLVVSAAIPTEVDVVVAGGSAAGVAAALAAREAGASVCIVAPRPYLGEDIAGTLLLVPPDDDDTSHPLRKKLYAENGKIRPTPMRIKKTFDDAVLAAGIPVRAWSFPCDVLKNADGRVAGIVFVSRNGEETVRAKVVVDATPRGQLARRAGGTFTPFPGGSLEFTRRILAAAPPTAEGVTVRPLSRTEDVKLSGPKTGAPDTPDTFAATLYECAMALPMASGDALAYAEAEQRARDLTWVPSLVDAADTLVSTPPDHLVGDVPGLVVAGPAADIPREEAARFRLPGYALAAGAEAGRRAAALAKSVPSREPETGNGKRPHGESVPRGDSMAGLPVLGTCDVFVAGAGTAGAPAAIAAARAGADTVVCDYAWKMGGVMTEGRIGKYWYGNIVGFTREIDAGLSSVGWVFSEAKAEWFRRECRAAGVRILFGAFACGTVVEDGAVTAVAVVLPDGTRGLFRCKAAIDSTGNSDLAAFAGARTEFIDGKELSLQGASIALQSLGASYQNSDFAFLNDTDPDDLTWAAVRARRGGGGWDQSQVPNTRERRRIVGAYQVTAADEMNRRTYPDVIVVSKSNFDTHGQTIDPLFFLSAPPHHAMSVNLPYRALLPETLDGLLVTGLGVSAQRDAMPILRMQPDVQNQGYAAGLAAAQAVQTGKTLRDIDIKALQRKLIDRGILPESVLSMPDNFPIPEDHLTAAIASLPYPTTADPYPGLAVLVSDPERAIPLLRSARQADEPDSRERFVHSLALALLGEASGVADILPRLVAANWDEGWNYRGMGQFGRSVSEVDGWIFALGLARATDALPAIVAKAESLKAENRYSHFRAVAFALERLGDSAGATVLARLLALPGVGGHALPPDAPMPARNGDDKERTLCLRELCLARALYRLGDVDRLGERTLRAYAADPRRAYAQHAKAVLGE